MSKMARVDLSKSKKKTILYEMFRLGLMDVHVPYYRLKGTALSVFFYMKENETFFFEIKSQFDVGLDQ
jgi:hypothetical protein